MIDILLQVVIGKVTEEASAAVRGEVVKRVPCEKCGREYVYKMARTGYGRANVILNDYAQDVATNKADANLAAALERECEPVPCPGCGWYQPHMFPRARRLRHRWMSRLAVYGFPCSVLVAIPGLILWGYGEQNRPGSFVWWLGALLLAVAAALLLALPVMPVVKFLVCRRYDPNTDPHRPPDTRGRLVGEEPAPETHQPWRNRHRE